MRLTALASAWDSPARVWPSGPSNSSGEERVVVGHADDRNVDARFAQLGCDLWHVLLDRRLARGHALQVDDPVDDAVVDVVGADVDRHKGDVAFVHLQAGDCLS